MIKPILIYKLIVFLDLVLILEDVVDDVVEAVAADNEPLVDCRVPLVKIVLWNRGVLGEALVELNRDVVGLSGPLVEVGALVDGTSLDSIGVVLHH